MTYLESEIIEDLKPFLNTELLKDLYCYKSINYRGQTTDSKNYFSEVISKFILDNSIDFNNIEKITRETGYKVKAHHDSSFFISDTNRKEEIFAKKLFKEGKEGKNLESLGKILDFQVPLKNNNDKSAGKIDLISYNEQKNIAYLIELKVQSMKEVS